MFVEKLYFFKRIEQWNFYVSVFERVINITSFSNIYIYK